MKVIILAAGQGTRLRPLTDDRPKCMVEVNGKSIIENQLDTIHACGIKDEDIILICGYCSSVLKNRLQGGDIHFITNEYYDMTNVVYSLMCAKSILESEDDIIISYGDIIYEEQIFRKLLESEDDASIIVDDGWYEYWSERCEDPLDDAETLMFDQYDYLTEIGQKATDLFEVQSQYIGLMRFKGQGLRQILDLESEAERRSKAGEPLWRTARNYDEMYMTDLLQGLIDEGYKLRAVHIHRGWFEIDDRGDLYIAESKLD